MSVSLEALAMAGADYLDESGMTVEEWARLETETPSHLLADEEEEWSSEKEDHERIEINKRRLSSDSRVGLMHSIMKKKNIVMLMASMIMPWITLRVQIKRRFLDIFN